MTSELQSLLKVYYDSIFPADFIYKWLNINEFRELSFCVDEGKYIRYLTFESLEEFKKQLRNLNPEKIDIGGIYNIRPTKVNHSEILKKELVFDIDLTDYNRECCTEKNVCEQCFVLIKIAVEILNYSLKNEFGFKKVGFVFSGRRGVHCWVSDSVAMELSDSERGEIVKFFESAAEGDHAYPEEYKEIIKKYTLDDSHNKKNKISNKVLFSKYYIKLDKNVTSKKNHLIKSPFCAHPSTGNIAVPIDPNNIDSLTLSSIPTLKDIIISPENLDAFIKIAESWL